MNIRNKTGEYIDIEYECGKMENQDFSTFSQLRYKAFLQGEHVGYLSFEENENRLIQIYRDINGNLSFSNIYDELRQFTWGKDSTGKDVYVGDCLVDAYDTSSFKPSNWGGWYTILPIMIYGVVAYRAFFYPSMAPSYQFIGADTFENLRVIGHIDKDNFGSLKDFYNKFKR